LAAAFSSLEEYRTLRGGMLGALAMVGAAAAAGLAALAS
jgi:hypothetical protein